MKNIDYINKASDIEDIYKTLIAQIESLIDNNCLLIGNLANISAVLNLTLKDINWVGFYLLDNNILKLGPFQGKPACTNINIGKGVCGTAVAERRIIIVPNVHLFPGHIACDSESNSEIVLPIFKDDLIVGVLDIDSPIINRFNEMDSKYLSIIVKMISKLL